MLAKITTKNQLTLPKAVMQQVGRTEYVEVTFENGRIILTPMQVRPADAVREKLAALGITEQDVEDAITWRKSVTPTRVVLDTNCLVSALIFSHGRAGQLRIAWQRGDIIPVVCRESVAELLRVLGYPKFKLRHEDIKNLLADVLPWAETLELNSCDDNIEFLRDRDDAVFIRLARAADTAYLVSGDRHLLELRGVFPELHIVSLAEFMESID
jgi:putative PIN family toxin of toxin-antitoxin system